MSDLAVVSSSSRPIFTATDRTRTRLIRIPVSAELALGAAGASKYWELETTGRFLASEHRDLSVSYVRSESTRDLNDYDQFFGNFRNPIIRPNENSLSPTDVPNRLIVRGSIGLVGQWVLSPLYEWRTGFPWSAVNEFQDFVGTAKPFGAPPLRLHPGLHTRTTVAFPEISLLCRPQDLQRCSTTGDERDVQNNITSPDYGTFYNPTSALDWIRIRYDASLTRATSVVPALNERAVVLASTNTAVHTERTKADRVMLPGIRKRL